MSVLEVIGEVMQFCVGDTVYNKTTGERGRIIRLMDEKHYVVAVDPDPKSGRGQREALWRESQITSKPDEIAPMLRRF
jgi:hypothetical protein